MTSFDPLQLTLAPAKSLIGFGGNFPQSLDLIFDWLRAIRGHHRVHSLQFSSIYRSEPRDFTEQPWFYNGVVYIDWDLDPESLLKELQRWEVQAGRIRDKQQPKGPRPLDLDLLMFADVVQTEVHLQLPHPRWHLRNFVTTPLLELCNSCDDLRKHTPVVQRLCIEHKDQAVEIHVHRNDPRLRTERGPSQ